MKKTFKNIDDYILHQPVEIRIILEKIRSAIKKAAPKAEEVISYSMPAFKQYGILVYFAAYNTHIGFYATPNGHEQFKDELSSYKQGKGSVQFPLDRPIPFKLIREIVKYRVKKNTEAYQLKNS